MNHRCLVAVLLGSLALEACATVAAPVAAPEPPSPWTSKVVRQGDHALRIDVERDTSAPTLIDLAESAVAETARRLAPHDEGSVLALVNRGAGQGPVKVPEDVRVLVRRALAFGEISDGAIDVTDGPIRALWDGKEAPAAEAIEGALERTDRRAVLVDESTGTLEITREGVRLDLDAMGRAYGLAVAAQRLETAGAQRYRLEHGNLVILGDAQGRYWKLPLPDGPGEPPRARRAVRVRPGAVSTYSPGDSGRTGGVIDPRTGAPCTSVEHAIVTSPDPVQSAALAMVLVVLGRSGGLALIESLDSVEALVIDDAGYVHASEGLREHVLREPFTTP